MKKRVFWIGLYVAAVVILAVIIYVVPSVVGLLDTSYVTKYGDLSVTDEIDDAWVIRDDTVYAAKEGGIMNRLVEDGTLVKAHSKLIEFSGSADNAVNSKFQRMATKLGKAMKTTKGGTPRSGYVSYTADGNEGILASKNLDEITYDTLKGIDDDYVKLPSGSSTADTPVFRITKNGAWWMVYFVTASDAKKYEEGESVRVTMNEKEIGATIYSVDKQDKKVRIILQSKEYCTDYLTTRRTPLTVKTESASGLLIQVKSIIEIDGQKGVLVKNKIGEKHFRPILIKASDGETAAIYSDLYMDEKGMFVETVANYDEIVATPSEKEIQAAAKELKE